MPVEHFKTKGDYRRNLAYRHIHGIPFTARKVVVGGTSHDVKHSPSGSARGKIDARQKKKSSREKNPLGLAEE